MKIKIVDVAFTAIFASLYAVLVLFLTPIAYGPLQFRIAGVLRPAIAKKWILAFGYAIGVVVGNIFSPFPIYYELIFMPIISLIAGLVGYLVAKPFKHNYFIAGAVIATIISFSVSWMLSQELVLNLPMIVTLPGLFISEQIICGIGAAVFKLVETRYKW